MYPFWEVPIYTSGIVIALIATFHILPSHLATGAFWFNVYIERKAVRENRPELMEFLKSFTLLILVFSFVIGSLTGVGIWFAATVASPRGISALIHNYVWGWATEWVFFLIEIATVYVYYYTFGKVDPKTHLRIGWIYAWAAWISMVVITGILAFMLSADKWVDTGNFFDGFFNSTYWPQLFTRTALMFGVAGLYAMIVASRLENLEVRKEIVRKAAAWGLAGMILGAVFAAWYLFTLPAPAKELALQGGLPYLKKMLTAAAAIYGIVCAYFLLFGLIRPQMAGVVSGVIMLVVLFAGIGAGEGLREGARLPYIVNNYMYGHQIVARDIPAKGIVAEVPQFQKEGFLPHLYLLPDELRTITPQNQLAVGKIIAAYQCGNCHALEADGKVRPLPTLLKNLGLTQDLDIDALIDGLHFYPFMPPFAGTEEEEHAVGAYLADTINHEFVPKR